MENLIKLLRRSGRVLNSLGNFKTKTFLIQSHYASRLCWLNRSARMIKSILLFESKSIFPLKTERIVFLSLSTKEQEKRAFTRLHDICNGLLFYKTVYITRQTLQKPFGSKYIFFNNYITKWASAAVFQNKMTIFLTDYRPF